MRLFNIHTWSFVESTTSFTDIKSIVYIPLSNRILYQIFFVTPPNVPVTAIRPTSINFPPSTNFHPTSFSFYIPTTTLTTQIARKTFALIAKELYLASNLNVIASSGTQANTTASPTCLLHELF